MITIKYLQKQEEGNVVKFDISYLFSWVVVSFEWILIYKIGKKCVDYAYVNFSGGGRSDKLSVLFIINIIIIIVIVIQQLLKAMQN